MAKAAAAPEPQADETATVQKYALNHRGFGKFEVEGTGKVFASKAEAEDYVRDLELADSFANEHGDILPAGYQIEDKVLMFRNSIQELPMNELYLPDGGYNPMYDRAWYYAWGSVYGTDTARKEARGYRLVTREELDELVEGGKCPRHYLSVLKVDGRYLLYGDAVLMRIPRVLWRQRNEERNKRAVTFLARTDESNEAAFDAAGMKRVSAGIQNEVKTGLKVSGF